MATLAIRGHETRGKEVIEILEMLGGNNKHSYSADCDSLCFFCGKGNDIIYYDWVNNCCRDKDTTFFTLEDFLENYPYKVGDKVIYEDKRREITKMVWEEQTNTVAYKLDDKLYCNVINNLQPYKEEIMEKRQYEELRMPLDDNDKLATEATIDGNKIRPPKNHLIGKITKVNNGMLVEFVKKQPEYPKNYKECCKVLGICPNGDIVYAGNWTYGGEYLEKHLERIRNFQKILICRDAYWKIAGEQMGLSKSWEPTTETVYCISRSDNVITSSYRGGKSNIFEFPTAEIRDAFKETFDEDIEFCKELL